MKTLFFSSLILFLITVVIPGNSATSQITMEDQNLTFIESHNVELISQPGLGFGAIVFDENYAYVGNGFRLAVFDTTDTTKPELIAQTTTLPARIFDIHLSDTYAVVGVNQYGLCIVDISNPAVPIVISSYRLFPDKISDTYGLTVSGNYAYLAGWTDGVFIIDFSDPKNPVEVSRYQKANTVARHVVISGQYLYVGSFSYTYPPSNFGIYVVDVSNPIYPREVRFYTTSSMRYLLGIYGNYLYIAEDEEVAVIDISNPTNPFEAGRIPLSANDAFFLSTYMYVSSFNSGLKVVDISNPTFPTIVGSYSSSDYPRVVAGLGNIAYLTGGKDLKIIDISDPLNPTQLNVYEGFWGFMETMIVDQHLYGINSTGLYIYDISSPKHLIEVGHLPVYYLHLDISNSYAYALNSSGCGNSDLRVIDVSDPSQPREVGSYPYLGYGRDVKVEGDFAYIAVEDVGLVIINISDPSNPVEVSTLSISDKSYSIAIKGDFSYISGAEQLHVINITDRANPFEVNSLKLFGYGWDLSVSGEFAYVVTTCPGWLQIIDISNPNNPSSVGNIVGGGWGLDISGSYAYVVSINDGIQIVDISQPSSPVEVGFYETPGGFESVEISGEYVYADGGFGFSILWFSPPSEGIIKATGGVITSLDGKVVYTFSSDTFTDTIEIIHVPRYLGNLEIPVDNSSIIIEAYNVVGIYTNTGQEAELTPDKTYTISIKYNENEIGPINEDTLAVYFWNDSEWVEEQTSSVNVTNNTITVLPNQLSLWAVIGETRKLFLPIIGR